MNFNPPEFVDSFRVGRKTPVKARSVKSEMKNFAEVLVLLKNAGKLKTTDFRSVYLSPDRNKQEHSKLVAKIRTMIKEDPSKYYFIRMLIDRPASRGQLNLQSFKSLGQF